MQMAVSVYCGAGVRPHQGRAKERGQGREVGISQARTHFLDDACLEH